MKRFSSIIAALSFTAVGCAAGTGPAPTSSASRLASCAHSVSAASDAFPARLSGKSLKDATSPYDPLISRRNDPAIRTAVRFCVQPDGQVSTASVVRESGLPPLDRAVTEAIRGWRFQAYDDSLGDRCKRILVRYRTEG